MNDSVTRRAVLIGSVGAVAGLAVARAPRRRIVRGVRLGRQEGVQDVAFLRDGARVVAADRTAEGTINVWDVRARRIERSFRVGRSLRFFALDEDRGLLAAAYEGRGVTKVVVFDFATGRQVRQLRGGGPLYGVDRLLVARAGLLISYADRGVPMESTLWSFETGWPLGQFGRPADALAADRRTVLGGRAIWDLESERVRGELPGASQVWGCALSADGSRALSEGHRRGILWNEEGAVVRTLDDQITSPARAAFSPDDRFLITARYRETFRVSERLLFLRDGRTGRFLAELPGHDRFVSGIAFSPDGATAVTGGFYGELMLWTMPGGSG